MKQQRISRWRQTLAGLVALIGSAIPLGCGSTGMIIEKPSAYFDSSFVSDYVTKHGGRVKGEVRQDTAKVNINGRLSAFVWENWSKKEGDFNERDFGLTYSFPIANNLTGRVGAQYYDYPTKTFGNYDVAAVAGVTYTGPTNFPVTFDLGFTQLMKHDNIPAGSRFELSASKPFALWEDKERKTSVTLTPSLSTAIIDNFYGKSGAFTHVTPGINLGWSRKLGRGKLGVNLFVNRQIALPAGERNGIESFTWYGVGINYAF